MPLSHDCGCVDPPMKMSPWTSSGGLGARDLQMTARPRERQSCRRSSRRPGYGVAYATGRAEDLDLTRVKDKTQHYETARRCPTRAYA